MHSKFLTFEGLLLATFPFLHVLYLLDQIPLLISCRSQIVTAPPDVLSEIVATLKYLPWLIFE